MDFAQLSGSTDDRAPIALKTSSPASASSFSEPRAGDRGIVDHCPVMATLAKWRVDFNTMCSPALLITVGFPVV